MEIKKLLNQWSEKLSIPIRDVEGEFQELINDENKIHSELSKEQKEERAILRLGLQYKKQIRSPAVGFEGMIIAIGDCVDMSAKRIREGTELFRNDPQSAISLGIADEEGNILDNREEWSTGRKNPNFGNPLTENFIRNIYGVALKINDKKSNPKFFTISLTGEKAKEETVPIFKPVRFMAIDRSKEGERDYTLNPSSYTIFKVDEKLILPKVEEIINNACIDKITRLNNLESYHNKTKDDYNRIVVTTGYVSLLSLEASALGNRVMTIEDTENNLENLESKGTTCWISSRCKIDFAEGSKVLVVGRTSQSKKKDENKNVTEELGDVTINVLGLYAVPEFKISLPELIMPITEDIL